MKANSKMTNKLQKIPVSSIRILEESVESQK